MASGASLSCATSLTGSGADTCRFASFTVSDPRFGRWRLSDLGSQFGVVKVIWTGRFVSPWGVRGLADSGFTSEGPVAEPSETGLSSTGFASRSGAAGSSIRGCIRYTVFSVLSPGVMRLTNPPAPSVARAAMPRTLCLMERAWKNDVHPVGVSLRGWSRSCWMLSKGSKGRGGSRSNEYLGGQYTGEARGLTTGCDCRVADLW